MSALTPASTRCTCTHARYSQRAQAPLRATCRSDYTHTPRTENAGCESTRVLARGRCLGVDNAGEVRREFFVFHATLLHIVARLKGLRLQIVRFSGAAWTLGVETIAFEGVPARITSPARTVVDCFRFERLLGPEPPMEALIEAIRDRKTTVAELSRIEALLPSRRLRAVLDSRSL